MGILVGFLCLQCIIQWIFKCNETYNLEEFLVFLKPPSPSTLIFALSTPAKLTICIKHSHWVMQPLLYQSLRVSKRNHDSDAKEHLHITWPLSKAVQHSQGLPEVVLHKMFWKTLGAKVFASTFSFQGDLCFSLCCCDFLMDGSTEGRLLPVCCPVLQ